MPKKKPKSRTLFQYEKKQNRKISKLRILVEHAIGGIKRLPESLMYLETSKKDFQI
ncbi:MAG: hypothetical protein IPL26_17065 [Leptospiraceae bacterium]|nr:hypothetical protein [Leptospiraceae bacterium]